MYFLFSSDYSRCLRVGEGRDKGEKDGGFLTNDISRFS